MSRENFGIEVSIKHPTKDEYKEGIVMVSNITHMVSNDSGTTIFFGEASIIVREPIKQIFQKGNSYGVFKILTNNA